MKINSRQALEAALAETVRNGSFISILGLAEARYGALSDDNYYLVRDFLRLNWSGAPGVLLDDGHAWVPVDGGNAYHFLHVSTDDANKVAYTKDEGRGRDDVQTRTTAAAYYEKYGRYPTNYAVVGATAGETQEAVSEARDNDDGQDIIAAIIGNLKSREGRNSASSLDIVDAVSKALDVLLVLAYK